MIFDGQLEFSFTSLVTNGCHRIGYRIQGSGDPYTIAPVNCTPYTPPNPAPNCVANITVQLNDQLCADVVYEGYVQPCCETEESLNGRVPFEVTFTPEDPCRSYSITCNTVGVDFVIVDTPGDGYAPGTTPDLIFTPTGDAVGTAKVEDDGVEAFTLTNPGSGGPGAGIYLNQQAIAIVSGASAHAFFDYTITGGVVTAISLTAITDNVNATGVGYTVGDTITLPGVWGVNPVITIDDIYDNGEILVTVITFPGTLYATPPIVTVDAIGGTAPGLTAELGLCPEVSLGNYCDGTPSDPIMGLPVGVTTHICRTTDPFAMPSQMDASQDGCCTGQICAEAVLTPNNLFVGQIIFQDCTTGEPTSMKGALDPDVPNDIGCIVQGSVIIYPPSEAANIVIDDSAPCP